MNIAVILAGGTGSRVGGGTPKQFLMLAGKTVLEHSVQTFENHPLIDQIAIVSHKDYIDNINALVKQNGWHKVVKVLPGGSERYESSLAALRSYAAYPDSNILIHDAARPLVSERIITDSIKALENNNAVMVGLATSDTIFQTGKDGKYIESISQRALLRRAQTPQSFKIGTLSRAFQIALKDPAFVCTDDCGIVSKYLSAERIAIVDGEEKNMKLTYSSDLPILETFID
ncbi:MAG: 2-C-methyl-D-erythritol 4-phosphate cytidylyltransferase [Bacteroidaceae bacterium]|nr:2-C-methyl-D-erythritol 4-phosphate cytidylyltransferase [Bacteroidaceae bacterium]